MRPGRLDRILYVGPPDHQGRMDILRLRAAKMAVDPDIDLTEIAAMVSYSMLRGELPLNIGYRRRDVQGQK